MLGEGFVEPFTHFQDFLCFDADVAGLAADAAEGLVEHVAGVGEGKAAFNGGGGINECACAGYPACADDFNGCFDVADHVEDGVSGFNVASLGIEVDGDVFFFGFGVEDEEFGADFACAILRDFSKEEDGAGFEEFVIEARCAGLFLVVFAFAMFHKLPWLK